MNSIQRWLTLMLLTIALVGCTTPAETGGTVSPTPNGAEPTSAAVQEVRLVTHDSFNVSQEVLAAFEAEHNAKVVIVPAGDAGAMVNQSILSANNPLGDVMFGVDNTFLTRALNADLFVPYEPAALAQVPDLFEIDPDHRVVPIDYGDVCLNYDIAYFEANGLAVPTTLEDLVKPEYKDLTVTMNPASSSPGLAFVLATVAHFGEEGWQAYWQQLRDNGILVTDGWSDAYFTQFSGGSEDGSRPIVVSYASSPAASAGATASVLGDGTCFRQIEFAGVLKNGQNPELAQALIDFMLTLTFQNDVSGQMYVYPVLDGATLPAEFTDYAQVAPNPAVVEPEFIEANRDALIEAWTTVVLR
jgi:thiamine transport system substrate-binding protein